ncbi:MAG TPA: ion transporter [Methylomirabilota bacterium]|nr:ion transporter [Methylomirabilota bacterium]
MPARAPGRPPAPGWRRRLHEIIFEADTPAGRAFDVALLVAILLSVLAVLLESMAELRQDYGGVLRTVEWTFTGLFTIEYALRLVSVTRPVRYAFSFFGLVDLLAILPTYLALAVPAAQSLMVIRAIRLLRVFRILKLARFLEDADLLIRALTASRRKITLFLGGLVTLALIMGTLMYLIEGEEHGFTSIPRSMYWAVVTMTTVGYGDIVPQTTLGRILAAAVMILGYSIIAVPTGIVSVELARVSRPVSTQACPACGRQGHDVDARHCKHCGAAL